MSFVAKQTLIDVDAVAGDNTVLPVKRRDVRTFCSSESAQYDAYVEQETRKSKLASASPMHNRSCDETRKRKLASASLMNNRRCDDELSSSASSSSFVLSNSSSCSESLLGRNQKSTSRKRIIEGVYDESLVDPADLDASSSPNASSLSNNSCRSVDPLDSETLVTRAYLRRAIKKNTEYHEKEIAVLRYENEILKANLRQYRRKSRKVRRIVNAAISRDDYLLENGNANLEQQPPVVLKGEIKSDTEDYYHRNNVYYGYGDESNGND